MSKLFSKTTGGFYADDVHAADQIPSDAVDVTDEAYAALFIAQAAGKVIQADANGAPIAVDRPAPTPAQVSAALGAAVKAFIDSAAQALGYDNIVSAISYADDATVPAYQTQGQALRAWRANVWKDATPVLNAVIAGTASPVPTAASLIATLPVFVPPTV